MSEILKGIPVSSGVAIGKAFIMSPEKVVVERKDVIYNLDIEDIQFL